jgi:hypothetical protein
MLAYDEFETFRAPKPKQKAAPSRDLALDDLHRTLYGSLHPSASRQAEEDAVLSGEEKPSWIQENAALTAAIAIVSVLALAAVMKKKTPPLQGPPDAAAAGIGS